MASKRIIKSKPTNISKVMSKFVFLWEGQYFGLNLKNKKGPDFITVIDKDFSGEFIPGNSIARMVIPFNGLFYLADKDKLWHSGILQNEVTVSDLIRCDYSRTLIKYSDSAPFNIEKIGILDPWVVLDDNEKKFLTRYFALHKLFWGSEDSTGHVKDNRSSTEVETFLVSADLVPNSNCINEILLRFNKDVVGLADHPEDFTVKINGVDQETYCYADIDPYIIAHMDGVFPIVPGDEISISLSGSNIMGMNDSIVVTPVTKKIINTTAEELRTYNIANGKLNFPHGSLLVGDKLFFGQRVNPTKITRFNNIDDLSDTNEVTLSGHSWAEFLVYDSTRNLIYFSAKENVVNYKFKIFSLDPDSLSITKVFESNSFYYGNSDGLMTDGEYVYNIGFNNHASIAKIRIEDWTLVAENVIENCNSGHNLKLHVYDDRTELYASVRNNMPAMVPGKNTKFLKINAEDLSYESVDVAVTIPTDDIDFFYLSEHGGEAYVVGEASNDVMAVINTENMQVSYVPSMDSFGAFCSGNDLIILGSTGKAINYEDRNFGVMPLIRQISAEINGTLNEQCLVNNRRFFSCWSDSGQLIEAGLSSTDDMIMTEERDFYIVTEDLSKYIKLE